MSTDDWPLLYIGKLRDRQASASTKKITNKYFITVNKNNN